MGVQHVRTATAEMRLVETENTLDCLFDRVIRSYDRADPQG